MLKKFMCVYMSFFDNELIIEQVEAKDELSAIKDYALQHIYGGNIEEAEDIKDFTVDEIKDFAFDSDSLIGVKEII